MVSVTTKIGQKGQLVIPKILREEYGMEIDTEIVIKDVSEGILLQKPQSNIASQFAKIAGTTKKKINFKALEEEYEERMKNSGLL